LLVRCLPTSASPPLRSNEQLLAGITILLVEAVQEE